MLTDCAQKLRMHLCTFFLLMYNRPRLRSSSAYVKACRVCPLFYPGLIEPPKAARGHATHLDGEFLNVTKNKITTRRAHHLRNELQWPHEEYCSRAQTRHRPRAQPTHVADVDRHSVDVYGLQLHSCFCERYWYSD